jgi:CheY-like chemotaxis protein
MEDFIRRTVGPAIEMEIAGAAGVWTILVDPNQLENALLNLSLNARDAMPDGGRLTIASANESLDEPAARKRDLPPGQYVALSVTDTGTGMPPEILARAFDPFFTTKPIGQGTGLGLSMIYGFVRQSGGQARINSAVGRGTAVRLYFPRHDEEVALDDESAPAIAPADAGAGEVVLIIDDEPSIRMLIAEVLEETGYAAIEAPDGPSGLRLLQSAKRIDLLITDLGLPGGMNGRQVAAAARLLKPGLKVLFITGFAESPAIADADREKGTLTVAKPFAMDALARKIRELIES